jgi:hypothetical protein
VAVKGERDVCLLGDPPRIASSEEVIPSPFIPRAIEPADMPTKHELCHYTDDVTPRIASSEEAIT